MFEIKDETGDIVAEIVGSQGYEYLRTDIVAVIKEELNNVSKEVLRLAEELEKTLTEINELIERKEYSDIEILEQIHFITHAKLHKKNNL
jgi:uncharacterized protein Yka (UPF0111/DUF47 family)